MAVGAEIFFSNDIDEIKDAVRKFAVDQYAIILVSDNFFQQMPEIIDRFALSPLPSITAIPSGDVKSSFTNKRLNDIVKKAIGIDISSRKMDNKI